METERDRGGVVNTGVRASDKVVWLGGKKINKRKKEQQDQSVFLRRPS